MALLDISNLAKSFRGPDGTSQKVVDLPEFTLGEKEQVALRGESGSGKSTLLNLIAGIILPENGAIKVADRDICKLSEAGRDRFRAQNIGYIFQTFNLLQGYTVLENVLMGMKFGKGVNRDRAMELIKRIGLEQKQNFLPRQLSTGQQQRVAVARALANHPKLVLADEPTGNLDSHNAQQILQLIRETCRENDAALLLVSHDQAVLSQFDTVMNLADINKAVAGMGRGV